MAFIYIGDNSHGSSLSRTKHNDLIMLPTLTASCLHTKWAPVMSNLASGQIGTSSY